MVSDQLSLDSVRLVRCRVQLPTVRKGPFGVPGAQDPHVDACDGVDEQDGVLDDAEDVGVVADDLGPLDFDLGV